MHGPDERLVHFLAEMVNPAVRPDKDEVKAIVETINEMLAGDGWALVVQKHLSGRPVYEGQRKTGGKQPDTALRLSDYQRLKDPAVFEDHLKRMAPLSTPRGLRRTTSTRLLGHVT
jgi:hypothetical protein